MFNSGGYGFDLGALLGNMMGGNRNNSGWGGDGGWWVLIILFALFGGWGNGNWAGNGGGSATQGALTRGDLCMDMNFNNLENGVRSLANDVAVSFANLNSTICNQQYDTASMINAMNVSNLQTANAQNIAALQNQNALQTQIAGCCCDIKSLFAQAEYNRATDACAITNAINQAAQSIIQNDNCNYRQLHDEQIALQMQAKNDQIAALQAALNRCDTQNIANAAVQSAVNQIRPTPVPAWPVPNPFAAYGYGFGYNTGCNCCGSSNVFGANVA